MSACYFWIFEGARGAGEHAGQPTHRKNAPRAKRGRWPGAASALPDQDVSGGSKGKWGLAFGTPRPQQRRVAARSAVSWSAPLTLHATPHRRYDLVDDPDTDSVVSWGPDGTR